MAKKPTLNELKKKYKEKDYGGAVGHYSDIFNDLAQILEDKFGIHVYEDPMWEGSCESSFIVSRKELTKKEQREVSRLVNEDADED